MSNIKIDIRTVAVQACRILAAVLVIFLAAQLVRVAFNSYTDPATVAVHLGSKVVEVTQQEIDDIAPFAEQFNGWAQPRPLNLPGWEGAAQEISAKDGSIQGRKFEQAIKVNIRPELQNLLAPIVAAIRFSENGGKGREYGILDKRCPPTYRSQAGWCAATVQKTYDRWTALGQPGDFIGHLGARYCPVGADNDPTGLNTHWVSNVRHFLDKFNG
jgi:hypothetical protein